MANRTDHSANSINGTDPQSLIDKILLTKIHQSTYWKDHCLGLTAGKPTIFICLVAKMLQIQPEKAIVIEFLKNQDYKYVRALAAFYLRLTGSDTDVYRDLEPLYRDYRTADGKSVLTHMDEFVDELLTKDSSCDIVLPRIRKRLTLESLGLLQPKRSVLGDDDFEEDEEKEEP